MNFYLALNRNYMIKNYFKVALRNLVKNKVYSFINIFGSAVGMSIAMLIGLWVWDELSFNQYHQNYGRIAQVMIKETDEGKIGYSKKFGNEERVGKLATFLAILAIFISCLGLFGLASFVAEQRTKEIGIRKVLGASVTNLWGLLSKDFVLLVIISCLISSPIAYYFMNNWVQKYEYHTDISWWVFVASGAGALIITLLTVNFQAIKAALVNPVKSLKTE